MFPIWDSRFGTKVGHRTSWSVSARDQDFDIGSILAIAYRTLPRIDVCDLKADKHLGSGSMFYVNRELYDEKVERASKHYVAVKYMRIEEGPAKVKEITRAVLRELRVLLHPLLRSHPHILPIFGYGWREVRAGQSVPFLVVYYADYGTLSEMLRAFSQQRKITALEKHDLALDAAMGLAALHECGFIHGDVKCDNVLVCMRAEPLGYTFGDDQIPWTAKIADFGSSFAQDEAHIATYAGTAVYNAPEIEDDSLQGDSSDLFEDYKKADVYSYGLLLWEIIKDGSFYLITVDDEDEFLKTKRYRDYLRRINSGDKETLLDMALGATNDMDTEGTHYLMCEAIRDALRASLRRGASERGNMSDLVATLQRSARNDRQPLVYAISRLKSAPARDPSVNVDTVPNFPLQTNSYIRLAGIHFPFKLKYVTSTGHVFQRHEISSQGVRERRLLPFRQLDARDMHSVSSGKYEDLTLQRMVITPRPPWQVQQSFVDRWRRQIDEASDVAKVSEAYIELSICYHVGFGVEPNQQQAADHLRQACYGNATAKSIVARVSTALNHPTGAVFITDTNISIFSNRVRNIPSRFVKSNILTNIAKMSDRPNLDLGNPRAQALVSLLRESREDYSSMDALDDAWQNNTQSFSQVCESLSHRDLCAALNEACKLGLFEVATELAKHCISYIGKFGEPTPLHWLIMFSPEQAEVLVDLLLGRTPSGEVQKSGICIQCLNARTSSETFLPEHCMELFGTPLHWAVRARHLRLVRLFLNAGANWSVRSRTRPLILGEPPELTSYGFTPLELAIEYHLYEIIAEILDHSSQARATERIAIGTSLLAQTTTPFARYLIHGSSYRTALRKTIDVLESFHYAMRSSDRFGRVPVLVSLQNNAQETYIIEELLNATTGLAELTLPEGESLASLVIVATEADHTSNIWKLLQVIPYVRDLNSANTSGWTALHYAAILGLAPMAEVLMSREGLDLEARSSNKYRRTAMMLAAQYGRTRIAELLLTAGVELDTEDSSGRTALRIAILDRQADVASLLIEHGAKLEFHVMNGIPQSSVLHDACIRPSNLVPMVKFLLEKHSRLRKKSVLNRFCRRRIQSCTGWTPLHQAVYYADLESVSALLSMGANVNVWKVFLNPDMDPRFMFLNKETPLDLITRTVDKAARGKLQYEQLKLARQGQGEFMRNIPYLSENQKRAERLRWENIEGTKQFEFRLEDVRSGHQGQAGVRSLIARLHEIKFLMDEASERELEKWNRHYQHDV